MNSKGRSPKKRRKSIAGKPWNVPKLEKIALRVKEILLVLKLESKLDLALRENITADIHILFDIRDILSCTSGTPKRPAYLRNTSS